MKLPYRKPTRLKEYDYSTQGLYFLTVCVKAKAHKLGKIVGCSVYDAPQLIMSEYGENIWQASYNDHIIRGEKDYQNILTRMF